MAAKNFQKRFGQVRERFFHGFPSPNTPQQDISQQFGPRVNVTRKMFDNLHAGTFGPVVPS